MRKRIGIILFAFLVILISNNATAYAASFYLNETKVTINVGDTIDLDATGTSKEPRWTSWNVNTAKVDSNGVVTAIRKGKTIVTAREGLVYKKCTIQVVEPSIKLSKKIAAIYAGGTTGNSVQLKATVKGASKDTAWSSSDEKVATVDQKGKVTAVSQGQTIITATANGRSAICPITVQNSSIILDTESVQLGTKGVGSSIKLIPTVVGAKKAVKWESSDKSVATVSGGKVTGKNSGTAMIIATANGVSATCEVRVVKDALAVSEEHVILYNGESKQLKTNAGKEESVEWISSDSAIVTVDTTGKIAAVGKGTAIISATTNGMTDTCVVAVKDTMTDIAEEQVSLRTKGEEKNYTLTYEVIGRKGKVAWESSDKSVVTVSKGKITAKKPGTAVVTATANGVSDKVAVTVETYEPIIKLNQSEYTLYTKKGNSYTLKAKVDGPEKKVTWMSSDAKIATVNKGKVTAVGEGEAIITATANGKSAQCVITVKESKVILSTENMTIEKGTSKELPADVVGKSQTVKYATTNSKVVTVKKGLITAKNYGEADIKVTANGVTSTCHVKVLDCDHVYDEGVVTMEPTCTEPGVKTFTCTKCGDAYTEEVAIKTHEYTKAITEPTCTEQGYTTYTCVCGDSYVDDYIEALGHAWGEWIIVNDSTETQEGIKERTCNRCGYVEEASIPNKTHEHDYVSVVTKPTCTEQGYTTYTCKCGVFYIDSYTDAKGHSWTEWFIVKEATESEAGEKQRKCTACDTIEGEVIPKIKHVHDYVSEVIAPTCTEQGYTEYTCVCGKSYKTDYVVALGHEAGEWVKDEECPQTCTQAGYERRYCTVCNEEVDARYLAASGHSYAQTELVKSDDGLYGYMVYECSNCQDKWKYHVVDIPQLGKIESEYWGGTLYPGESYEMKYESMISEEMLPYVSVEITSSKEELLDYITVGGTSLSISEDALFDTGGQITVQISMKDNPYHERIVDSWSVRPTSSDTQFKESMTYLMASKGAYELYVKEKEILNQIITEDMNEAEKILAVHDWLAKNVTYDITLSNESYYMESAILKGKAVCGGYTQAFRDFMILLNIPCQYVRSDSMNHAWNQVQIEGEWYWLDVTWDDLDGREICCYDFFLNSGVRAEDEEGGVSECTGRKWQGLVFEKYYVNSNETMWDMMLNQSKKEEIFLVFHSLEDYTLLWEKGFASRYGAEISFSTTDYQNISVNDAVYNSFLVVRIVNTDDIIAYVKEEQELYESHEHVYTTIVTEPGCEKNGYTQYSCECGYSYSSDFVPNLGGHVWSEWIITREPTETETGSKTRTCTRCNHIVTQILEVLIEVDTSTESTSEDAA